MSSIGKNIAKYRKAKNITQEQLAEICGVSPQAVSKWENDVSCPDVSLFKTIAKTFSITVDALFEEEDAPPTFLKRDEKRSEAKLLKIRCEEGKSRVSINLPLALAELLLQNESVAGKIEIGGKAFRSIDFKKIVELVSLGVMGKLIEVEDEDGEKVEVWVE